MAIPEFEPDGTLLFGFGLHTVEISAQAMEIRSLYAQCRGVNEGNCTLSLHLFPRRAQARPTQPFQGHWLGLVEWNAAAWLWASGGAAYCGRLRHLLVHAGFPINSCHNPANGSRCTNESA